jgi:branched-chain amino acid transport system substrate-binding protein
MIAVILATSALLLLQLFGEPVLHRWAPVHDAAIMRLATIALLIALAIAIDRLFRRWYWQGYARRRTGRETPKLVQDIVTVFIVALGIALGLVWQEGLTLTGIAATSIGLAAAIGVALQPDIQDVFSGLAMNYENTCGIGDWVTVDSQELKSPIFGCITGLSWRSTFLTMEDGCRVSVPNHLFTSNPVINHSRAAGAKRLSIDVSLDARVPSDRVLDLLLGETFRAVRAPGLARNPDPDAMISRLDPNATVFTVRFWYHPEKIRPSNARAIVLKSIHAALLQNPWPMPVTQVEMTEPPNLQAGADALEIRDGFSRSSLFSETLDADQIERLAASCRTLEFPRGTVIMNRGDPPAQMYLVLEGAVGIEIEPEPGKRTEVAISASGDVVGEMSLLTGAERNANVTALTRVRVLEITKDAVAELLKDAPELFERLSGVLARRQIENSAVAQRSASAEAEAETYILDRMREFFGRAFRLRS